MKRHRCVNCGAKRFEKFMKKKYNYSFWRERFKWVCDDGFCGNADAKMYGLPCPLILGHKIEDSPGHTKKDKADF